MEHEKQKFESKIALEKKEISLQLLEVTRREANFKLDVKNFNRAQGNETEHCLDPVMLFYKLLVFIFQYVCSSMNFSVLLFVCLLLLLQCNEVQFSHRLFFHLILFTS